jgi:hypothetical protein
MGLSIRMRMAKPARDLLEVERTFLGGLCAVPLSLEERGTSLRKLAEYNWRSPDHRVIYEALRRSRQPDSAALREHIAAEITRLGFPDIDITPFFVPSALSKTDIARLADTLLAARSEAPDTK